MLGSIFCCQGADIMEEHKTVPEQKEPNNSTKSREASVIPARRKSVKKMAGTCAIHCICGKCFNAINKAKAKILSLPKPTASAVCSCPPLHASGSDENKTKVELCNRGK